MDYLKSIWDITVKAAPWLLIGLLAAAVIRAWVPTNWIVKQLGRRGLASVLKASAVGIPLPLCSCGVLPTALGLRRQGASKPATAAFLVSTPEIGLDSFALSYVLLGPFMAIVRPIAAFVSAIAAGLAALVWGEANDVAPSSVTNDPAHADHGVDRSASDTAATKRPGLADSLAYVFGKLLDDIKWWLAVAVIIAGIAFAVVGGQPDELLVEWGQGPEAMLVMLFVGVPLYVCATASTPIAAALLVAGVSPGTVLVLLLAGPATNIGSIAILRKELGTRTVIAYLAAIAVVSIGSGLVVDWLVGVLAISVAGQIEHAGRLIPHWVGVVAAVWLIAMAIGPVRRLVFRPKASASSCCGSGDTNEARAASSCCRADEAQAEPQEAESSCCCSSSAPPQPQASGGSCCGSQPTDAAQSKA